MSFFDLGFMVYMYWKLDKRNVSFDSSIWLKPMACIIFLLQINLEANDTMAPPNERATFKLPNIATGFSLQIFENNRSHALAK